VFPLYVDHLLSHGSMLNKLILVETVIHINLLFRRDFCRCIEIWLIVNHLLLIRLILDIRRILINKTYLSLVLKIKLVFKQGLELIHIILTRLIILNHLDHLIHSISILYVHSACHGCLLLRLELGHLSWNASWLSKGIELRSLDEGLVNVRIRDVVVFSRHAKLLLAHEVVVLSLDVLLQAVLVLRHCTCGLDDTGVLGGHSMLFFVYSCLQSLVSFVDSVL